MELFTISKDRRMQPQLSFMPRLIAKSCEAYALIDVESAFEW